MSTEKNVQIVKKFLAALGRRDKQDLLALSADDIEWIIPGEDWPLAGTHRGHAGLENLLQKANETVETSFPEPPEFVAQGDRVLIVGFARGRIKATNRTFEDHWVFAITIRNGKVTNIREYVDTQALARGSEPAASALTHRAVSSRQSESADPGECMIANALSESRSVTRSRHGITSAAALESSGINQFPDRPLSRSFCDRSTEADLCGANRRKSESIQRLITSSSLFPFLSPEKGVRGGLLHPRGDLLFHVALGLLPESPACLGGHPARLPRCRRAVTRMPHIISIGLAPFWRHWDLVASRTR